MRIFSENLVAFEQTLFLLKNLEPIFANLMQTLPSEAKDFNLKEIRIFTVNLVTFEQLFFMVIFHLLHLSL